MTAVLGAAYYLAQGGASGEPGRRGPFLHARPPHVAYERTS